MVLVISGARIAGLRALLLQRPAVRSFIGEEGG
jgi:hypothetical protein